MKDYFKFNLKAQKLLPAWLTFMVLFMAPYLFLIVNIKEIIQPGQPASILKFYGIFLILFIVAYAIFFYILKYIIEGFEFKGKSFVFEGTFGQFIGKILSGILLSIITIGIYTPWFVTKMHKFFIDNTTIESDKLSFAGTAGKLFKIVSLTLVLPLFVLMITIVILSMKVGTFDPKMVRLYTNLFTFILMTPYLYFVYKWMVNIKFKNYTIRWETRFWNSCGKIILEIFLSIITIGIYYPYAGLRLYKYFIEKTFAVSESSKKGFGYDIEAGKDFLFLWGQLLLTIITLGIYYPWACCKIMERIVGKTYTEQITE